VSSSGTIYVPSFTKSVNSLKSTKMRSGRDKRRRGHGVTKIKSRSPLDHEERMDRNLFI
jgi:hypothetical protein